MRGARAATVVGLVLVAGCSGASGAQGGGPLSDYLGEYAARMQTGDHARAVAAEEAIASCMHAEGFDYVPRPEGAWHSELVEVTAEHSTLAWAEEHGYGLVDGVGTAVSTAAPDPNEETLAAMSEAERTAYDQALLGAAADDPQADVDGCAGPADQAAWTWWEDATYQHFRDETTRIEDAVDDDAQVTAAATQWRACAAERGHPELDAFGDGMRLIADEVAPYQSTGSGSIPVDVRPALLEREIQLATTERGCDEEVGLTRTRDGLVAVAQRTYVDEHRAELDAWELSWPAPSPS